MLFWSSMLQIWDSWSVTPVTYPVSEEMFLQFSHLPFCIAALAMLYSWNSDMNFFLWNMLMSKLILSLEILWGLFTKCVRASYSSSNTVCCGTRTVLLFVGLHWFSNTIIFVPVHSGDHFLKNLYNTACHTHEDRAIWYSMWFTEEIRKLFVLNSSMLKVFPKWYD